MSPGLVAVGVLWYEGPTGTGSDPGVHPLQIKHSRPRKTLVLLYGCPEPRDQENSASPVTIHSQEPTLFSCVLGHSLVENQRNRRILGAGLA